MNNFLTFIIGAYLLVTMMWYESSNSVVSEETIGMYEYRDNCIAQYGPIEKCSKPIDSRKSSREKFWRFQMIVFGSALGLYVGYKLFINIFTEDEE